MFCNKMSSVKDVCSPCNANKAQEETADKKQ